MSGTCIYHVTSDLKSLFCCLHGNWYDTFTLPWQSSSGPRLHIHASCVVAQLIVKSRLKSVRSDCQPSHLLWKKKVWQNQNIVLPPCFSLRPFLCFDAWLLLSVVPVTSVRSNKSWMWLRKIGQWPKRITTSFHWFHSCLLADNSSMKKTVIVKILSSLMLFPKRLTLKVFLKLATKYAHSVKCNPTSRTTSSAGLSGENTESILWKGTVCELLNKRCIVRTFVYGF